ncbi:MAG: LacI family DNA-binding transcriptional regulator [Kibdelosporangium sp.]
MNHITIKEVAALAGVSVATASRALTGTRNVSPAIVTQVTDAARRLGYRRNAVASALRSQTTGIVGLVVPQVSNPFFPLIIEAVERALHREGYNLLLSNSRDDPELEADRVRALLEHRVDGLVISPCDAVRSVPVVRETSQRVPLVQFDRKVDGEFTDWVGLDDEIGISRVVAHLRETGARSFAFISSGVANSSGRLRLAAYQRAINDESRERTLLGDFTIDWGRAGAKQLLAQPIGLPDAIICGNDMIALGVLQVLLDAGLNVPDDVAVTGYDDISFAELSTPRLTSVHQPYDEMAEQCVRLLVDRMTTPGKDAVRRIAVAPTMVARASSAVGG